MASHEEDRRRRPPSNRRSSQDEGKSNTGNGSRRRRSRHRDRDQDRSVEDRNRKPASSIHFHHHRSPPHDPQPPTMQQPPEQPEQQHQQEQQQENQQPQDSSLPIPPPPQHPPSPARRGDRKRRRDDSPSPRSPSKHRGGRRHRHRDRGTTSRRYSPSRDDDGSGEEEGRRRHRSRRRRRRRSSSYSSPRRRGGSRSISPRRRQRRGRESSISNRSVNASLSSSSSSPDSRNNNNNNRRDRRRKRRRRPHRRRRGNNRGSRSSHYSPRSEPRHHHPGGVANDVPPRAGVVTDDDDGARHHQNQHPPSDNGIPPPPQQAPTAPSRQNNNEASRASWPATKKRSSHSSSHDDTTGHFKGREGTLVADRYRIQKEVGVGTFGRVVECLDLKRLARSNRRDRQDKNVVAIKIVRNVKRYYESALIEADIVEDVNRRGGRGISHCAVMYDAFTFAGHYCMVFERLGPSLYDFQKRQKYRPFPLMCVRDFAKQLLETLEFLHSFRLIHTDLKPENILLLNDREVNYKGRTIPESTRIKVIDFGGATYDNEKKSSVVNTRQYRAPEVILGVGWSMPSDLWSIGCILAELYQGELLFATHDNVEHLALIEQVVGPFPRRMLKRAKNTELVDEAFDSMGVHRMERVLPPESLAYVKRIGSLESLTRGAETWFLRLLRRILVTDPDERATARECLRKL